MAAVNRRLTMLRNITITTAAFISGVAIEDYTYLLRIWPTRARSLYEYHFLKVTYSRFISHLRAVKVSPRQNLLIASCRIWTLFCWAKYLGARSLGFYQTAIMLSKTDLGSNFPSRSRSGVRPKGLWRAARKCSPLSKGNFMVHKMRISEGIVYTWSLHIRMIDVATTIWQQWASTALYVFFYSLGCAGRVLHQAENRGSCRWYDMIQIWWCVYVGKIPLYVHIIPAVCYSNVMYLMPVCYRFNAESHTPSPVQLTSK